ncbi:MAG: hypothetical protein AVDCRST_MAG68-3175 [uncultured Gemmatimonadetes bacterium]|uniref:Uncharacterized protein n=1 Tax=uncultured Gemmatimonadota bacterium TaxID=203437 RepID=A0A6J4LW44_9BACT|nr:MAG: hypothetical protein AVDCRST_MAG68-3175 [uncultured Gemmatimonadota bacterium]
MYRRTSRPEGADHAWITLPRYHSQPAAREAASQPSGA